MHDNPSQGILGKLGGGAGGHKNWKNRYFVLTDHLAYYTDQATFAKDPTKTLGVISLNCYFCSKVEGAESNDFQVNAYPKSLVLRAANDEERDAWIEAIMQPLEDMLKPPAQVSICGFWRVVWACLNHLVLQVRMEQEQAEEASRAAASGAAASGSG